MSEIDSIILNGIEYELAGGGGTVTMYSITNNLTNVTTSNGATSIREGRAYSATLSLASGATLDSVTVTMGGTDITSSAWNVSTMTINIASVTNDIVITARAKITIEETITWSGTGAEKTASPTFDLSEYDLYLTIPFESDSSYLSDTAEDGGYVTSLAVGLYNDAEASSWVGWYNIDTGEIVSSSRIWSKVPKIKFGENTLIAPKGQYYAQIIISNNSGSFNSNGNCGSYLNAFANKVTLVEPDEPEPEPEEISNALRTDNDLLQVYAVRSLSTDIAESSSSYEGVIEEAKNAWMHEYSGDINKIPLICHADQHDEMGDADSKAMWKTIDDMVSWYDVSKVINFGDTTNSYENFDDPTLGDSNLEAYLDATENIPFSKRIEIFGNHDCMKIISGSLTYIQHEQGFLKPYFKNAMARQLSNNGYHVIYDPYFNVKYIVYSNYDYVDSSHYDIVSSAQYDFLIEEMTKDDGYDIIMLGHQDAEIYQEKVGTLVSARVNKTSGTFTDKEGNSHSYDFSNCDTDLLVCLHGHSHSDGYNYDMDILSQCFDNYYDSTRPIFFVIVDRTNRQLKAWKVKNTPAYETYTRPFDEPEEVSS